MRRIEHLSSKHSSPRDDNDDEDDGDYKKTKDLINKAQNIMGDNSSKHMSTEESGQHSRTGRSSNKKESSMIINYTESGEIRIDLNPKQASHRSNSKAKSIISQS